VKKKIAVLLSVIMVSLSCFPISNAFATGNIMDIDTGEASDVLTTYVVTTGSESDIAGVKNYEVTVPVDPEEIVLPITFEQKGILYFTSDFAETAASRYFDLYCYSDAECTKEIKVSTYNGEIVIPEAGTYYLKFKVNNYSDVTPTDGYKINFSSKFISGEDKTLTNKVWVCSANADTQKPMYFEVDAIKAGSITINTESEYSTRLTLLNSSKKAISDEVYNYDGKACFAVEKGSYYIKVTSSSDLLRIKSLFTALTDYSGSSKAKAKKLTAGKTYTGFLSATDKTSKVEWYKITLTKSQEVNIKFTGSVSSGKIELELYGNGFSGSITKNIDTVDEDSTFSPQTWSSTKLPKGTYYIKITKKTTNTSGYYYLQLKK
jgi:hypothetical protein